MRGHLVLGAWKRLCSFSHETQAALDPKIGYFSSNTQKLGRILVRSMREPWLFWGSLAVIPFAIICFMIAMRVTSERLTRAFEVAGEIIAGVALPVAGYEGGFRYAAKDIWELKAQTSAGLLFITLGVLCI